MLCLVLFAVFQANLVEAQVQTPRYVSMTGNSKGYYEYLPQGYNAASSETYPLLIFLHGQGESGDGSPGSLPKVLANGPPRLINNGQFPSSFTVGGQTFKFIVISPQFVGWPLQSDVQAIINYLVANYRVNTNRIYLTGLSMGGGAVWDYAGETVAYANRLAAIVPVCGASYPEISRARHMAEANLPVWATHNEQDGTVPVSYTNEYVRQINLAPAPNPLAKKTLWQSGSHDAWTKTYDPNFRENGLNVYEWMLSYSRNSAPPPPTNLVPTANAGPDANIALPLASVQLNGSGSNDPDGSIVSYSWARVAGTGVFLINNANIANPTVTGLVLGSYTFRLTVTDNKGATATDDVVINVSPAPNQTPVVNAGSSQSITLPANTVTLNATASDADGVIASYSWTRVSGPANGTITNPTRAQTTVTGLTQGTYVYQVRVTDNDNAVATSTVNITVNAAAAPNQAPTVSAGSSQTIILPANNATLTATASDPDGTISSYAWSKVSGPAGGNIISPSQAQTNITSLTQGNYVFQVRVTDNDNAQATSTVNITVNGAAAPNQAPTVNAGAAQTIVLPANNATLVASASDPDGSITSYAWSKVSGPAGGNIITPSQAQTFITGLTQGSYVYRVRVTDNDNAEANSTVTITVNAAAAPNQLPTVSAGSAQTITLPANNATLTATASDPDGSISSYTWSKLSGAAGGNIITPSEAETHITNLVEGNYTFQIKVTDNSGASAVATVAVMVVPAAAIPPPPGGTTRFIKVNVYGGQSPYNNSEWNNWNVSGTSNINSGALKYSDGSNSGVSAVISQQVAISDNASNYAGGMAPAEVLRFTSYASGQRTLTINGLTAGKAYSLELYASRVINQNETSLFTVNGTTVTVASFNNHNDKAVFNNVTADGQGRLVVTISNGVSFNYLNGFILTDASASTPPANQSPVASAGNDVTITLPTNSVQLVGTASDPDGIISSYKWEQVNGSLPANISNSNISNPVLNSLVQGTYTFRFTVVDNAGASVSDDIIIRVNAAPANQPPTVSAGNDQTITLPVSSVTVSASASDNDGTITGYAWTRISGPANGTITSPSQAQTTITSLSAGIYVFEVRATDNGGATATSRVTITVNDATTPPATTSRSIKVNIYGGQNPYNNPEWNNWNTATGTSNLISNLYKYSDGSTSSVYTILSSEIAVSDNASNYAGGMAVGDVLRFTSYGSGIRTLTFVGLTPSKTYDLELYASRVINNNEATTFTAGGVSTTVQTFNNHDKKANFSALRSDAQGRLVVTIRNEATFNYLNGFILTEISTSGQANQSNDVLQHSNVSEVHTASIYPNPITENFLLRINSKYRGKVMVQIADVSGSTKKSVSFNKDQDIYQQQINVNELSSGTYYIIVTTMAYKETIKAIKL